MRRFVAFLTLALPLLLLGAGCGGSDEASAPATDTAGTGASAPAALPQGSEPVELDPADFVSVIDNPFWPMAPGSRWVYRETDGEGNVQRVVVTVTDRKKSILGIEATVVHDVVSANGLVIEDTFDWYAQDRDGNVWYLGEDTKEYEDGKLVSTEGSWEAGVDGGQAGVIMPGRPEVGLTFRQEYLEDEAEDRGEILSLDERVNVPFGSFENVLMTKDSTPLEPDVLEHKFYARSIGPVLTLDVSGGSGREELLRFEAGR
jgi:hypothetical protein